MSDEQQVPERWSVQPLAQCVEVLDSIRKPVNFKQRATRVGNIPYYGATGQVGWIDGYLFDEELVLVGEDGAPFFDKSKPIAYIINGKAWVNNHAHVLRARPQVTSNKYIKHYLDSFDFTGYVQGSTRDKLTQGAMNSIPVLLPPRDQQDALVRLIDAGADRRSSALAHLSAASHAIERFRRAVLSAACSGRLTADWRADVDTSGTRLRDSLSISAGHRRKPVAQPIEELLTELPPTWDVVILDLLIDRIEAGKSFSADGQPARDDEWGIVKVSAMSWGRFLENENKAVPAGRQFNAFHEIKPGDLLISRANTEDLVGATVLVGETRPHLLLSDKSLRLIPKAGIDKAWLNFVLRSPVVRSQFSERATGTSDSMRNLSQEKILATTVPLPPTEEQQIIAHRVRTLLAAADQMEARIAAAASRVERSGQAILAKAFRGELVDAMNEARIGANGSRR